MELKTIEHCVEAEMKPALAAGWFGTFIDFYILAVPVRLISSKIGAVAIFMNGFPNFISLFRSR